MGRKADISKFSFCCFLCSARWGWSLAQPPPDYDGGKRVLRKQEGGLTPFSSQPQRLIYRGSAFAAAIGTNSQACAESKPAQRRSAAHRCRT
jgi:hypothetical protein